MAKIGIFFEIGLFFYFFFAFLLLFVIFAV